jgi:threonyl-tRNA synthetase
MHMNITFLGETGSYPEGTTALDIIGARDPELRKSALAAKLDGELVSLSTPIGPGDHELEILTFAEDEGRKTLRHSASHVLAQAVLHLIPDAKLAIGPAIENGFYYDFDVEEPFTPEFLTRVEK